MQLYNYNNDLRSLTIPDLASAFLIVIVLNDLVRECPMVMFLTAARILLENDKLCNTMEMGNGNIWVSSKHVKGHFMPCCCRAMPSIT